MSDEAREEFPLGARERRAVARRPRVRAMPGGASLCPAVIALVLFSGALVVVGCIGAPQHRAATQPVTVTDPSTTQPSYWLDRPSSVGIAGADFDRLWRAAEQTILYYGFTIDRADRRHGVLTSAPMVSSQFFELWRRDVRTVDDSARASLATTRRTLRFEFARSVDGTWEVTPKVLVERQTVQERRITSVVLYRGAVTGSSVAAGGADTPRGTQAADEGRIIPPRYWYATGRDPALEKALGDTMREKLKKR